MNYPSNPAEIIKSTLSMLEVSEWYGYHPNRSSFIACPFHQDKTASLKIYKEPGRGFHCFGCNAGGSVIDFVMCLFGLSFPQAVVRLNADFNLGLCYEKPDMRVVEKMRRERADKERALQKYRDEYDRKNAEFQRLWQARQTKVPPDPEFMESLEKLENLEFWFENHPWK